MLFILSKTVKTALCLKGGVKIHWLQHYPYLSHNFSKNHKIVESLVCVWCMFGIAMVCCVLSIECWERERFDVVVVCCQHIVCVRRCSTYGILNVKCTRRATFSCTTMNRQHTTHSNPSMPLWLIYMLIFSSLLQNAAGIRLCMMYDEWRMNKNVIRK